MLYSPCSIKYWYFSGNRDAKICEGDMMFYWLRQVVGSDGNRVLCLGEGPITDTSPGCTGAGVNKFNIDGILTVFGLSGIFDRAAFMYGKRFK